MAEPVAAVYAEVAIEFTVTRPNVFDLATEAGKVIDAELAKLPGSRLVELSIGPAREYVKVVRYSQGVLARQWTAECRAVLARG